MKPFLPVPALLAALLLVAACGDDGRPAGTAGSDSTVTGGPCMNNTECDYLLCQQGTEFPGGVCTISCGNSGQCASGSSCAELAAGWLCLVDCMSDTDCRDQWGCQPVTEAGTNGGSMKTVCLGFAAAP